MNRNLTFLVICSTNDVSVEQTLISIVGIGNVLLIDGGPRKNQNLYSNSRVDLLELSKKYGCEYLTRNYDYAAAQYNFGLGHIKTEWAFIIDSDERISADLAEWLAIGKFNNLNQFKVKRYNYFLGNKIRYGQFKPDWNVRLIKPLLIKYEDRQVHARMKVIGKSSKAQGYLEHYTVISLDQFFSKMLEFSALEPASRALGNQSNESKARIRYKLQKLPFQAKLRFIYSYFWRLGFLDGRLGLLLAKSAAFYEDLVSFRKLTGEK